MKTAIIGYGRMGKLYDRVLHAAYIVDILPVAREGYFGSLKDFLNQEFTVDLAIVATPTPIHGQCAKMLLDHGYNVLCEKPLCFSSAEAKILENIAKRNKLLLCQSTLERYNPVIRYTQKNIRISDIDHIVSYRFGANPPWDNQCDPLYDLGIHDLDLWFYLTNKKIPWRLQCGYGSPKREITIYLKQKGIIVLDLLNKKVRTGHTVIDLSTRRSNPISELISYALSKKNATNELWSQEIEFIEKHAGSGYMDLKPTPSSNVRSY